MLRHLDEGGKLTMDFRTREYIEKKAHDPRKGLTSVTRVLKLGCIHDLIDADTRLCTFLNMTSCIHSASGLHHLGVTPIRKLSGFSNHSIYSQQLVWHSKRSFSRSVRGEVYSYNSIHTCP